MRGGKREGAGRKKQEETMVIFGIRVPEPLKQKLKEIPTEQIREQLEKLTEKPRK